MNDSKEDYRGSRYHIYTLEEIEGLLEQSEHELKKSKVVLYTILSAAIGLLAAFSLLLSVN